MKNKSIQNFTIETLGCKVNQFESETIAQNLLKEGLTETEAGQGNYYADLCIINTCAVTQKAAMQSRQAIRRAIRLNPKACVIVTGCYAQTEPDEINKIKGVDLIIEHTQKLNIPEIIVSAQEKDHICLKSGLHQPEALRSRVTCRTRPFLKIQDGCNAFCTYCIVPYARGRSRSMPPGDVIKKIEHLNNAGHCEVVLTGIHLGAYGFDLIPKTDLAELLNCIQKSNPVRRLRLSSIEPLEITEEIIKIVAESDVFCNHFHIPLQSGDDNILKKMHRPYSSCLFQELIMKIYKFMPDAAIGVDVLIGFPGESNDAFDNTYALIEKLPVSYLHVFPFSSRKQTPAGSYPDQVPVLIIKDRCKKMRLLGIEKKRNFYKKFTGNKIEVLIETKRDRKTGLLKGISSNYIHVLLQGENDLKNSIVKARIDKITANLEAFGTIIE